MVRIGTLMYRVMCPLCLSVYLVERKEINQEKIKNEDYDPEDEDDSEFYYKHSFFCPECNKQVNSPIDTMRDLYSDAQIAEYKENNKQYINKDKLFYDNK